MKSMKKSIIVGGLCVMGSAAFGQVVCETDLVQMSSFDTIGQPQHAVVVGPMMYLADGFTGLQIVDVSDPMSPVFLGSEWTGSDIGGNASDVDVVGNLAYVTDWWGGFHVFDVSNPMDPVLVGKTDAVSGPRGVEVHGQYAYVADGPEGLKVIDVSMAYNPIVVGSYDTTGSAEGVTVDGGVAYLACGIDGGFQVIDVSDPFNPTLLIEVPRPNNTLAVAKRNNTVFLADGGTGLSAFDVSDPSNPVLLDVFQPSDSVWDVVIDGSRAYIALNTGGAMAVNIGNPSDMVGYEAADTMGWARWVAYGNNRVYASDTVEGVVVFDVVNECTLGCPVDYNEDGVLNFFDVSLFIGYYHEGSPRADLNGDGRFNFFDVSVFIEMYQAGCP